MPGRSPVGIGVSTGLLFTSLLMVPDADAQHEYPYHQERELLVVTRGDEIVERLPCERIPLAGGDRWGNDHIRAHVGRTTDGTIYAEVGGGYGAYWVVGEVRGIIFASSDGGRTWQSRNVDLPDERVVGAFTVLDDDSFLAAATQPSDTTISYFRSKDRGQTWEPASEVTSEPFRNVYIDGNLVQLQDGTILSLAHYSVPPPEGAHFSQGTSVQYVLRSTDGGRTWEGGPDPTLWQPILDAKLTVAPVGPDSCIPGVGGTFPGCYETGLAELSDGRIAAVLRFSGPQYPWHEDYVEAWGGAEPDNIGRIFRQVMLSFSLDGGRTWEPMRPFVDAQGTPIIVQQETNGQMVETPDGRLVLIHQRRFGAYQLIARVSEDRGETWLPDEYRLSAGFGYSGSVVLDDGTIVTVTGQTLDGEHAAQAIRWRLP
ncbi:MAG: sialidase family protein [Armatimonadota bacterium]